MEMKHNKVFYNSISEINISIITKKVHELALLIANLESVRLQNLEDPFGWGRLTAFTPAIGGHKGSPECFEQGL